MKYVGDDLFSSCLSVTRVDSTTLAEAVQLLDIDPTTVHVNH